MKDIIQRYRQYVKETYESDHYYKNLAHYLRFVTKNDIDLFEITEIEIEQFIEYMEKLGLMDGTINANLKTIRTFYRFLFEEDEVEEAIYCATYGVTLKKVPTKLNHYLTIHDIDKAIRLSVNILRQKNMYKIRAILYLIYYTGIQRQELIELKREDIDLEKRTVNITSSVSKLLPRTLFFPKKVKKALIQYFQREKEDISAFNMHDSRMRWWFEQLRQYKFSGKKFSFALLRDTFANLLAQKQVSIGMAHYLLGYKNLSKTETYYAEGYKPNIKDVERMYRRRIN